MCTGCKLLHEMHSYSSSSSSSSASSASGITSCCHAAETVRWNVVHWVGALERTPFTLRDMVTHPLPRSKVNLAVSRRNWAQYYHRPWQKRPWHPKFRAQSSWANPMSSHLLLGLWGCPFSSLSLSKAL
jgi:hypothetical protein